MLVDTACPDSDRLRAFRHGAMPRAELDRVWRHIEQCAACRATVAAARPTLADAAAEAPAEAPAGPPGEAPAAFPFLRPPQGPDEIGRLGNYRVLALLGCGGMAYVFLAHDDVLDRPVALKVLRPELAGEEFRQRFLREARTLAAIKHEHIVTVYQAGNDGDAAYFAMELLEGETLHDWQRRNPRPDVAEVVRLARELADGLAFLHKRGLVHRDVKPANIWLEGPGRRVKVLDLGLVRPVEEGPRLTEVGLTVGTPGFMSPEQVRGRPLDARSDLFSLGCVLYSLCTGKEPFDGPTVTAILASMAADTPAPVRELNPKVPEPLESLVAQLLAKDPAGRPPSADTVRRKLELIGDVVAPAGSRPTQSLVLPAQPDPDPTGVMPEEAEEPKPSRKGPKPSSKERRPIPAPPPVLQWVVLGAAALLVLGIVGAGVARWARGDRGGAAGQAEPGPTTYLKDLKPVDAENWPIPVPRGPDGRRPGEVIHVGGRLVERGLFMHPPPAHAGAALLSFRIGGKFDEFRSEATFSDGPPGSEAAVRFRVYGDGKLLWESRPVWSQRDAQPCRVSVRGVNILQLSVSCDGEPRGAHAVWVDPAVTR